MVVDAVERVRNIDAHASVLAAVWRDLHVGSRKVWIKKYAGEGGVSGSAIGIQRNQANGVGSGGIKAVYDRIALHIAASVKAPKELLGVYARAPHGNLKRSVAGKVLGFE